MRKLVLLFSLVLFAGSAIAKPSDWADVIERPGDRSSLPRASENAPQVVTNARATKATKAKKASPAKKKAKAKAKKASRRGKAKKSRR